MTLPRLAVFVLAMAWGLVVATPPPVIGVEIRVSCGEEAPPVRLEAEPILPGTSAPADQVVGEIAGRGEMALDPSRAWSIRAHAESCWAEPVVWPGGEARYPVEIEMVPTGLVRGRFRALDSDVSSREAETAASSHPDSRARDEESALAARFAWPPVPPRQTVTSRQPVPDPGPGAGRADEAEERQTVPGELRQVDCSTFEQEWSCSLPAGRYDLRLEPAGFAAVLLGAVEVRAAETTRVADLPLRRAASVSGWVRTAGAESNRAKIVLVPLFEESPPLGSTRASARHFVAWSNERGQFEVPDVPPGPYRVEAEREGFASEPIELEVPPRSSAVSLAEPLDLVPLARLELALDPPRDPWGRPWSVELSRAIGETNRHAKVFESEADLEGAWHSEPMRPAAYSIDIRDSTGSRWGYGERELVGGREEMFWPIEVVPFEGLLAVGDEPLPGVGLTWGPNRENIRLVSDENGRFEGFLPHEGFWGVELAADLGGATLAPVEIRRRPGKRSAEVEVRLPDTLLRGRVLADGEPTRALVVALTESEELGPSRIAKAFELRTDDEGRFEVLGLVPDRIEISASARGLSSASVETHIREGEKIEIEIELREQVPLRGRLVSAFADQAGASLLVYPDAGYSYGATTLDGGRFALPLGSDVARVDLFVLPPAGGAFVHRIDARTRTSDWTLEVGEATGTIVLPDASTLLAGAFPRSEPATAGRYYFFHEGIGVPADSLLRAMFHRWGPHPSGGMALPSMAIGTWSLCKGADPGSPSCRHARLFEGAEVVLEVPAVEADESSEEDVVDRSVDRSSSHSVSHSVRHSGEGSGRVAGER